MNYKEHFHGLSVERRPDCVAVALSAATMTQDGPLPLAQQLWDLMQIHFSRRIVLELGDSAQISGYVLRELTTLARHIIQQDGMMRVCGLSQAMNDRLRHRILQDGRHPFPIREELFSGPDSERLRQLLDDDSLREEGQ